MKVAIVGAGAIGCWLGARFASAGHDVSVLARGETLQSLRTNGLRLTEDNATRAFDVIANSDAGALGIQDIVVVAVKAPSLKSVAPAVHAMLAAHTIVIPAMNGVPWWFAHELGAAADALNAVVDADGSIAVHIPPQHVVGCVVHANASLLSPGHARRNMGNAIIIGEPQGGMSERVTSLAETLRASGVGVTTSAHIRQDVWYKLWGNMTMNPVSALTGATADRIIGDDDVRALILAVMAEASAVGAKIGCRIEESGENRIEVTRKLGAFRTSMLQDVEAGRAIELDALLGAPRAIARAVGVPTPYLDMLLGLARLFGQTRGLVP